MKKVLVTGGAGFIGSNVVDLLIKQGYDVVVVDNFSTGKKENVNPKARLIVCDLVKPPLQFKKIAKDVLKDVDVVFHLAALPRVEPSIQDPVSFNEVNVTATVELLDVCRKYGVKNVIYSSSSSIYGNAKNVPTDESEPVDPMSPYALQKLIGEQYAELYCKLYKMNITCLRYFNVYGNREPTEGAYVPVIGIWLQQYAFREPITITGDGEQSRDFINVEDVAHANIACMKSKLQGYNVFNVGSGQTYPLNYLASLISDNVKYIAARIEPRYTKANIELLCKKTGWAPTLDLENYLADKVKNNEKTN